MHKRVYLRGRVPDFAARRIISLLRLQVRNPKKSRLGRFAKQPFTYQVLEKGEAHCPRRDNFLFTKAGQRITGRRVYFYVYLCCFTISTNPVNITARQDVLHKPHILLFTQSPLFDYDDMLYRSDCPLSTIPLKHCCLFSHKITIFTNSS